MCRTFKSQPHTEIEQLEQLCAMCPPNLRKLSRFGGGVLSHTGTFSNITTCHRSQRRFPIIEIVIATLQTNFSLCHCLCCIYLLIIYTHLNAGYKYHMCTSQICASFSTGSGSGGRRSRINSLVKRTDCKPPPKELGAWTSLAHLWFRVEEGIKKKRNFNMQVMKHHLRSVTSLRDRFQEFSRLVPTDSQETKTSLNWLTQ